MVSSPELANLEMYSLICEFIQSELSKNNNIFIVSKDDQEKLKDKNSNFYAVKEIFQWQFFLIL